MRRGAEEVLVFSGCVKAWTGLARKLAMSVDGGIGKALVEREEQLAQGGLLFRSAGVLGMAVRVETAHITHADGTKILPQCVSACEVLLTPCVDRSVAIDYIVITNVLEATGLVPAGDVCHGIVATFASGCTMNDKLGDLSHINSVLLVNK